MDIIHHFGEGLGIIGGLIKLILEPSSVFCIILGFFITFVRAIRKRQFINVSLQFGTGMSLALEFQLAANILATRLPPQLNDLYQLVIVYIIRPFLNFFLQREIKEEMEVRQKTMEMSFII